MNRAICAFFVALLFLNTCIYIKVQRVRRGAVGGVSSELDEFPFMAALGWTNNATGEDDFLCGGVLIAPNFVLTAAHCLFFEGELPSIVQIGGNNLNTSDNEEHAIKTYFKYPDYKNTHGYDDIAILQLEANSKKHPAPLWAEEKLESIRMTAIGYGTTQYAGSRTPILHQVELVVMQESECEKYFREERKFPKGIADSHICAGDPSGKQDTCQGDSGGPLLVEGKFAAGIISSGQACAGHPPAVYTRIATYINWIAGVLKAQGYTIVTETLGDFKRKNSTPNN